MKRRVRLFFWAISISFFGTLPLGTLNLCVASYAFRGEMSGAIEFSVVAITVELLLVRVALMLIKRLEKFAYFLKIFGLLTAGLLLFLAFSSLLAALEMQSFRAALPFSFLSPVVSGLLLSAANPLHLPFWMGWTTVLRSKKILVDEPGSSSIFIAAIGMGTALGFFLYDIAGGYLIGLLGSRQVLLNWIVGVALLVTALIQLYKMFFKDTETAIRYETTSRSNKA